MDTKQVRPSRFAIAEYWLEHEPLFVTDIGEPCCFACGYFEAEWYRPTTIKGRWEESQLERAHILSPNVGGTNDPSNFVLLCRQCHTEQPMSNNPITLMEWAKSRDGWFKKRTIAFFDEMQRMGLTHADAEELLSVDESVLLAFFKLRHLEFHPKAFPMQLAAYVPILKEFLAVKHILESGHRTSKPN